ncbi:MAG: hypothetical protein WAT58_08210 [Candidatus Dormiibacterota bacterium]
MQPDDGAQPNAGLGIWTGRVLALLAIAGGVALVGLDLATGFTSHSEHSIVSAVPLALIAVANLVYHAVRRPPPIEMLKAGLLSAAFIFWSLYQLLPTLALAPVFNDLAIALFVLDITLIVAAGAGGPRDP